MQNITISRYTQIFDKESNTRFRVLNITQEYLTMINMDTLNKCDIRTLSQKSLFEKLKNETFAIIDEPEDKTIIDEQIMEEHVIAKYKRNKHIVEAINTIYAPDYTGLTEKRNKPIIQKLIETTRMTRASIWRIIIKYLQNGCKESSLLRTSTTINLKNKTDRVKRGRISAINERNGKIITDKDREIMAIYTKKYLNNRLLTLQKCYDDMIIDHYTIHIYKDGSYNYEEVPYNQRPTFYQFRYFVRQHANKEERLAAKIGKRKFRNEKRLLRGTSLSNVHGPGDVFEIDACELDLAVVSALNRSKAVGSPVVYFMVDVFSRLIVGASLSFDNNSLIAMTNCMTSLVEDKAEILKSVGINVNTTVHGLTLDDVMPSNIKPRIIRADHGSDFISKETQRIAKELAIELQYVPPGTGSMKGVVERSFRSFQRNFTDLTINAGTKDYTEGKSKHNQQAKLSIEDVRRLMYSFILNHNTTQFNSAYDLTPDMVTNNVGRIPAEIWRYGIKHIGNPPIITDIRQFLYTLLIPAKAKLHRNGIRYKNLRFIPNYEDNAIHDAMFSATYKPIPIEIRIDLRRVGTIYYVSSQKQLQYANLVDDDNHRIIGNMTWPAFEAFRKEQKRLLMQKEVDSDKTRRAHRRDDRDTVQNAKALSGKGRTDDINMRATRATEKNRVSQEYAFENRFGFTTFVSQNPEEQEPILSNTQIHTEKEEITPNLKEMTEEQKRKYFAEQAAKDMEDEDFYFNNEE